VKKRRLKKAMRKLIWRPREVIKPTVGLNTNQRDEHKTVTRQQLKYIP